MVEDVLPGRELFEKAPTVKWFEYSPIGKKLNEQTDVAKGQYHGLNKAHKLDKEDDNNVKKV